MRELCLSDVNIQLDNLATYRQLCGFTSLSLAGPVCLSVCPSLAVWPISVNLGICFVYVHL
jgi:hypothetical protein